MPKKQNTRRTDGRIAVQVYIGMVDGKRKYKTVYGATQKEANKKAEELKIKLNKGIDVSENNLSFSFWAEKFSSAKKKTVSAAEAKTAKYRAEYFATELGNKDINKIKLFELQSIIDELAETNPITAKPSSKKTVIEYTLVLKQIFKYAIANRVIDYNPAESVVIPIFSKPKKERTALTKVQQQWIIDTPHRAQTAAMIMLYTGLRRGELTALLWSDVNFQKKTITVSKSYDSRNRRIKDPKTEAGNRTIPIPDVLFNYLSNIEYKGKFVCPSQANTMLLEGSWYRLWNSYMQCLNKKYGDFKTKKLILQQKNKTDIDLPIVIDTFTPHQLRHTYCTTLYDAGVDVVTAKYLMGHSDIKVTLNIYTHLSDENKETNIDKLNMFLNNASQMQVKSSI